ncbi:CpsB/CapC family capsule biosynthesis tyrosine phosphatase [Faecalimonas sp.]
MRGLTDIHNHILPMVDDGAKTVKEALKMLRIEVEDGVENIILTPHYRKGMFETTTEEIEWKFQKFREIVKNRGIEVELYLGRECYADTGLMERVLSHPSFRMNESKYILIEFSYHDEFQKIRNCVYKMVSEGYHPVLAHIERYASLHKHIGYIEELIQLGAYIQVNASTILGKTGWSQKCFCRKLLQEHFIHFIASDAHDLQKRPPNLRECKGYVEKKVGIEYAKEIFVHNPQLILEGK